MSKEYPQICQVVASINENIGGPAYSVTNLAKSLTDYKIDSHLFTLDYRCHGKQLNTDRVKLYSKPTTLMARYFRGWQPQAKNYLARLCNNNFNLIHNHGLWMFPNTYARQVAIKNKIPLVISPRGMLESWSLKNSRYKKQLAWFLYERENLDRATVFHATSECEMESIRQLGYKQPIALIPNGVKLESDNKIVNKDISIELFPELRNKKWLLFLSRIHPKKGIDNLLRVWSKIGDRFTDWHLIIAGSDLIGYRCHLETLTKELNLEKSVTFTGMVTGDLKISFLSNAELFVLPTHSENFGIAIAESLAYEVPVITTKNAPWKDLIDRRCGWWIENDKELLERTLIQAISISSEERKEMGIRGKILVKTKYSWDYIGEAMSQVYYWILENGIKPSCLYL